jgi:hypothetical protein
MLWIFDIESEKAVASPWWRRFKPEKVEEGVNCVIARTYRKALFPCVATRAQILFMIISNLVFTPIRPTGTV